MVKFEYLLTLLLVTVGVPALAESIEVERKLFYIGDQFPHQGQPFPVYEGQPVGLRLDENGHVVAMRYPGKNSWVNTPTGVDVLNADQIITQLRTSDANRAWLSSWLVSVGGDFEVINSALDNVDALGWNVLNANEGSLSIPLGNGSTVFVKLEPQGGSELEPSLIALVGDFPRTGPTRAEGYLTDGEFAKAAQQALLDLGYDPKGVDGAPGAGARSALEAWANDNGLIMPPFTRDYAGQIAEALTAPPARYASNDKLHAAYISTDMFGLFDDRYNWLGMGAEDSSGQLTYGVLRDPETSHLRQVTSLHFSEIGYGFFIKDDSVFTRLASPAGFDPFGTVLLHGTDKPRFDVFAELWRNNDIGRARIDRIGRAGATLSTIDASVARAVAGEPHAEVLWTVVDHRGEAEIVVADVQLDGEGALHRFLFIFADYPGDEKDEAIMASFIDSLTATPFPFIAEKQIEDGLGVADCNDSTASERSSSVARHLGYHAFPTRLCDGDRSVANILVWNETNASGDRLTTAISFPNGGYIPIAKAYFDEDTQSNVAELRLDFEGTPKICRIFKPSGGISVLSESQCISP